MLEKLLHPSTQPSIYLSTYASIHSFIRPPIHPSIHPSIHNTPYEGEPTCHNLTGQEHVCLMEKPATGAMDELMHGWVGG